MLASHPVLEVLSAICEILSVIAAAALIGGLLTPATKKAFLNTRGDRLDEHGHLDRRFRQSWNVFWFLMSIFEIVIFWIYADAGIDWLGCCTDAAYIVFVVNRWTPEPFNIFTPYYRAETNFLRHRYEGPAIYRYVHCADCYLVGYLVYAIVVWVGLVMA